MRFIGDYAQYLYDISPLYDDAPKNGPKLKFDYARNIRYVKFTDHLINKDMVTETVLNVILVVDYRFGHAVASRFENATEVDMVWRELSVSHAIVTHLESLDQEDAEYSIKHGWPHVWETMQ